jgi:hypothetical protein
MSALNTIAVTAVLLGLQVAVAVANGPPKLDLAPTCDAAARFSIMAGRDKEACPGGRVIDRKHPGPKLVEI